MRGVLKCAALLVLAAAVWNVGAFAQGPVTNDTINPTTKIDTKEFPLWAKDLRRGEIIAFGSFPFTMFFTTFAMDAGRYFDHDRNADYAPWPFKGAGAINMTTKEYQQTMAIAAAASVTLALTDYLIVRIKRNRLARKARNLPAGDPIIINRIPVEDLAEDEFTPPASASPVPAP
ncbi:hypothetical protein FACS1894140_2180 [Spirochaetia bacterium]|nr:hypothetical protein FACS1894140_2180 [Spirochaetia bacterium]